MSCGGNRHSGLFHGAPVHFLNKKIRRVILAQFKEGENGIFDFFDVVSDILYDSISNDILT